MYMVVYTYKPFERLEDYKGDKMVYFALFCFRYARHHIHATFLTWVLTTFFPGFEGDSTVAHNYLLSATNLQQSQQFFFYLNICHKTLQLLTIETYT